MFKKDKKPKKNDDDEAAKKAAEDADAKKAAEEAAAKAEEERKAKEAEEAAGKAKEEEDRKAKEAEEAARKAKEEEDKKAKEAEEAARKAKEEEDKKAKEAGEAARKAKEEEERKAKEAEEVARKAKEEAERKAKEEEKRRKKEEEEKAKSRRRGQVCAPMPEGVPGNMDLSSIFDLQVAFNMLDKQKKGFLDRKQARDFLRCAGWIIPDENLDMMLDGVVASLAKLFGSSKGTRSVVDPNATFTFDQLVDIVEKNMKGSNSSLDELVAALVKLAGQRPQIKRKRFQDIVCEAPDFNDSDVETILQTVDLSKESFVDCKTLAARLLEKVCQPPSILDGAAK